MASSEVQNDPNTIDDSDANQPNDVEIMDVQNAPNTVDGSDANQPIDVDIMDESNAPNAVGGTDGNQPNLVETMVIDCDKTEQGKTIDESEEKPSVLQQNRSRRPSRDYSISSIFTIRPRRPSADCQPMTTIYEENEQNTLVWSSSEDEKEN